MYAETEMVSGDQTVSFIKVNVLQFIKSLHIRLHESWRYINVARNWLLRIGQSPAMAN